MGGQSQNSLRLGWLFGAVLWDEISPYTLPPSLAPLMCSPSSLPQVALSFDVIGASSGKADPAMAHASKKTLTNKHIALPETQL